ncbi:hypothetical protein GP5015_1990 [gamma proteobacterium HTCC5015]|nr:hypothetical protein GP5015_1990 [gamma proteobacterium HTCC5015]
MTIASISFFVTLGARRTLISKEDIDVIKALLHGFSPRIESV